MKRKRETEMVEPTRSDTHWMVVGEVLYIYIRNSYISRILVQHMEAKMSLHQARIGDLGKLLDFNETHVLTK